MEIFGALGLLVGAPILCLLGVQVLVTAVQSAHATVRLGSRRFATLDAFVQVFGEELDLSGVAQTSEPSPTSARFWGVLRTGRCVGVQFAAADTLLARAGIELDPDEIPRVRRFLARGDTVARLGVPGVVERLELRPRTGVAPGALGKPMLELSALVREERAGAPELRAVLAALDALAATPDLPRLKVCEAEPAQRCALCHGDLGPADDTAHACDGCGAVLHLACWSDLGRCPALGCRGQKSATSCSPPARR